MTVRLCDRCGKKLSSDFLQYSRHYQIRSTKGSRSGCLWERMWCDICQDCSKELEDWLKKGGKHDEQPDDKN